VLAEVNAHISEYASEANLHDDVWEFIFEAVGRSCSCRGSRALGAGRPSHLGATTNQRAE
jgi:hypothetical protein